MAVVLGYTDRPEGRSALRVAVEEARRRGVALHAVHSAVGGTRGDHERLVLFRAALAPIVEELRGEGIACELHEELHARSPAEDLADVAGRVDAAVVVIGLRRRSPVGKFALGSTAQEILLRVDQPVLAVKSLDEV